MRTKTLRLLLLLLPLAWHAGAVNASGSSPAPTQTWIGSVPRVTPWAGSTPADRVRLSLRQEGVYRVTVTEIASAMGVSVDAIAAAVANTNLALSCQGSPVAWYPDGTNLFFYGVPAASRFAPENVYWVAIGPGATMSGQTLAMADPPTTNGCFVAQYMQQGTDYLNRVFYSSRTDVSAAYIAFAPMLTAGSSLLLTNPLPGCATGTWTGTVTVNLLSLYDDVTPDNHTVNVKVGGMIAGQPAWSDEQYLSFTYPFSSSNLTNGAAVLTIANAGSGKASRFLCMSVGLTYARVYQAANGFLRCTGGSSNIVAISGFSTNDVVVWDITTVNQPTIVSPVTIGWNGGTAAGTAVFPCGGTDRVYCAFSETTGVNLPSVRGVRDIDWTSATNAADYVILIPPEGWVAGFRAAMQPLADFRAQQGLHAMIVDVESLYNCFSYGLVDPQAIQAFCGSGYSNWSVRLRYVLLAGAGAMDYTHARFSVNDYTACLIPTVLAGQAFPDTGDVMIAALDSSFGTVTGGEAPRIAIGRIPTTATQDLATVVQKTIAYEGSLSWKQQVAVAADGNNEGTQYYLFSEATDQCITSLLSMGRTVVTNYPAGNAGAQPPSNLAPVWTGSLQPALQAGCGLFHYFGHSSDYSLGANTGSQELFGTDRITSANFQKPPIAVFICCRVNHWHALATSLSAVSLAPYGLLATNTGFVAALAPTAYFDSGEGASLEYCLYQAAASNGTLRLGDVMLGGLQGLAAAASVPPERLQCFSLIGDPALVFRQDVTAMGTPTNWLGQYGLTAPNADLANGSNGWPIWQEYLAGTNPTGYVLRITAASVQPGGDRITLGFETNSNATYRIFYKENLLSTDAWQVVPWAFTNASEWSLQAILPNAPVTTVAVSTTNTSALQGFYRVCWTN